MIGGLFPALVCGASPQQLRARYLQLSGKIPICADIVSLHANLDNLVMGGPAYGLSEADVAAFNESFSAMFANDDEVLQLASNGQGVLLLESAHRFRTSAPHRFCGKALRDIDANEPSDRRLRTLEAELQMLLHEHPVNLEREESGLAPLNAVWFWGGSSREIPTPSHAERALPLIHAADITLRGLMDIASDSRSAADDRPGVERVVAEGGIVILDSQQARADLADCLASGTRSANMLYYGSDGQLWNISPQSRLRRWLSRALGR